MGRALAVAALAAASAFSGAAAAAAVVDGRADSVFAAGHGVERSLAAVGSEIKVTQQRLDHMKRYCDQLSRACEVELRRTSARLARLMEAEAQLRQREAAEREVYERVKTSDEAVAKLQDEVAGLHVFKKFAQLSKEDVDKKAQKMADVSTEYGRRIVEAQKRAAQLKKTLEEDRRDQDETEARAVAFIAEAKGIERAVNSTDLYADAELTKAVRRQHTAESLYLRAQALRKRAQETVSSDHDENSTEVQQVLREPTRILLHDDHRLGSWGRAGDFGGRLPLSGPEVIVAAASEPAKAPERRPTKRTQAEPAKLFAEPASAAQAPADEDLPAERAANDGVIAVAAPAVPAEATRSQLAVGRTRRSNTNHAGRMLNRQAEVPQVPPAGLAAEPQDSTDASAVAEADRSFAAAEQAESELAAAAGSEVNP